MASKIATAGGGVRRGWQISTAAYGLWSLRRLTAAARGSRHTNADTTTHLSHTRHTQWL